MGAHWRKGKGWRYFRIREGRHRHKVCREEVALQKVRGSSSDRLESTPKGPLGTRLEKTLGAVSGPQKP